MYKDKEAQKIATKERVRRYRDKHKDGISETVTPWHKLKDYLSHPCCGMSRLERTQRICGSLNKYSRDVFLFGVGLTAAEIGAVIGTQQGLFERDNL